MRCRARVELHCAGCRGADSLLCLVRLFVGCCCTFYFVSQEALLPGSVIGIQAALLYTTSSGERRINVHTMSLPVTTVLTELFKKVRCGMGRHGSCECGGGKCPRTLVGLLPGLWQFFLWGGRWT